MASNSDVQTDTVRWLFQTIDHRSNYTELGNLLGHHVMDHTGADKPYTGLARPYGGDRGDDDLRILDILVRHHQRTAYPCVYARAVYFHGVCVHFCFHASNVDHWSHSFARDSGT